ncbi:TPA: hypothetical protein ACUNF5_006666 [Burkholderia orbicola]
MSPYQQLLAELAGLDGRIEQARARERAHAIEAPTLEAPAKLNKKREQNGKVPFFDYRVLAVRPSNAGDGRGRGGQHASPKAHIRRGHIRRLERKTVWVSDTLVNAGSARGVVVKDYAVRPLKP